MTVRYADAGINLQLAAEVTERITARLGSSLFGGFVPIPEVTRYTSPVLVTSIDGIGTKVHLAAKLGRLDGLGADIVHHCVNDIAVHGAKPLLFMDYLAFYRLEPETVERLVAGMAVACDALGIRLAGGETAEMPLVYGPGSFDVAGAIVGVVEEGAIVDGSAIQEGDVLLGLPSSGLHTNGFSLVQQIFGDEEYAQFDPLLGITLGEVLLVPHRVYLREIEVLIASGVHGLAHITGGGIAGNLSRILPAGLQAVIELPEPPVIFRRIGERGVPPDEMRAVFNLGIGLIAVAPPGVVKRLEQEIPDIIQLGRVVSAESGERSVVFRDGC